MELVSAYLRASAPRTYCDACLAFAVQEAVEAVHQAAEGLTEQEQFARKTGRCRTCRSTKRLVTRAAPTTLACKGSVGLAPTLIR